MKKIKLVISHLKSELTKLATPETKKQLCEDAKLLLKEVVGDHPMLSELSNLIICEIEATIK